MHNLFNEGVSSPDNIALTAEERRRLDSGWVKYPNLPGSIEKHHDTFVSRTGFDLAYSRLKVYSLKSTPTFLIEISQ